MSVEYVEVRTQADLNKALQRDGVIPICIGDGYFEVGSASVSASGSASVRASGSASVRASGSASVRAYGSASVRASGSASVRASGSASVRAYDSASVRASGSASVSASGSASVRAYDSASVSASGSASVRAYDSASVRAYDSASVRAYDSASVRAYDSASVRAYDSASVRAYDSASVRASKYVAVHNHGGYGPPTITGGVVIDVPRPATPEEWCDYRGVEPDDQGVVVLYKAVGPDWRSGYGFSYEPGKVPVAPDWDGGKAECGGGLHFCAQPVHALPFHDVDGGRFVGCPVRLEDIVVHEDASMPQKIKAKGCCGPVFEVDIDGRPVGADRA